MKFLHVISSMNPEGGGPVESIRQFAEVTRRLDHESEVLTVDAPDSDFFPLFPFPIHAVGPGRTFYQYSAKLVPWLLEHASDYDAIFLRGLWRYSSFGSWRALKQLDIPYYVFTHGMLDPWFKRHYPLKHLKKSLYWPWADYRVLRDAKVVLFTSEEERVLAKQSFWPYRCNEQVIRYGTAGFSGVADEAVNRFKRAIPELENKRFILFLGRIHEKKGCDLLLQAFADVSGEHQSIQLVFAGPDQVGLQSQLESRANGLGLSDRVHFPGMLQGDLKWGAFLSAEVFALPSHQENFGIAVVEAMSCGVPVLISNRVNIWREIESAGAGLVADDTQAGTSELLSKWLDLSDENKDRMSANARSSFAENFEIKASVNHLINLVRGD